MPNLITFLVRPIFALMKPNLSTNFSKNAALYNNDVLSLSWIAGIKNIKKYWVNLTHFSLPVWELTIGLVLFRTDKIILFI